MANLNPMVYVKLVCHQCNQKYAFDVLPVNNQMPVSVKCPVCKTDGTPAANLFLAQKAMGIMPTPVAPTVRKYPVFTTCPVCRREIIPSTHQTPPMFRTW